MHNHYSLGTGSNCVICVHWGEEVAAGSLTFCGRLDAKEIQNSVCSLQMLAPLLLLLIASGTGVGNGRDKVRFFLYTFPVP